MKKFKGLQKFEDVINFIESESKENIISDERKREVYKGIMEARKFVIESDECGRRSALSKALKRQALERVHPIYIELNIDYEVLGALLGRSAGWFTLNFKELGLERKSNQPRVPMHPVKYHCDVTVFNTWNADSAYWLGFIWADGHVRNDDYRRHLRIVVQESDSKHLEHFQRFLKTNIPVNREFYRAKKDGKQYPQAVITINRKELVESLLRHNVLVGRSVNDLSLPDIPERYLWDFFRGYFDGDGAIHRPQLCEFLCSGWAISFAGSRSALEVLKEKIYTDTGIEMDLRRNGESQINFSLTRTGPAIFEILERLYPDHVQLGLERKKVMIRRLLKAYRFARNNGVTVANRGDGLRFIVPKDFRFLDDWEKTGWKNA